MASSSDVLDAVLISVWNMEFKRVSNLRLFSDDLDEESMMLLDTSCDSLEFICSKTDGGLVRSMGPGRGVVDLGLGLLMKVWWSSMDLSWILREVWADVGTARISSWFTDHRYGSIVLRESDAGGSESSF